MSDDQGAIQDWIRRGKPKKGDAPAPAEASPTGDNSWMSTASRIAGSTAATVQGMGKGLAEMGAPPGGVSLRDADPKGPVATWAKSEEPDYPVAEGAGRLAAQYLPLAMLPSVGLEGLAAKTIPEFPRAASIIGRGLEGTWKGGVGGATQGDTKTGAATGGGLSTAYRAYQMLPGPRWMLPVAAIMAMSKAGGEGYVPWDVRHILSYLAEAAGGIAGGKIPGVAGALGAKAFGGDDGGQR